jgi:hypothetical protein
LPEPLWKTYPNLCGKPAARSAGLARALSGRARTLKSRETPHNGLRPGASDFTPGFKGSLLMKTFEDGAYAMAALSAAVVAFRILVKKGLVTRDEAVRALLDEAVQRAIFAETKPQEETIGQTTTAELSRQSAEILKLIAESL